MATPRVRSSRRLKSRKPFRMPTRDDVLSQIEADRTPHKGFSQLRPRKLIHDLVKGHNRYNNLDPISLYDDDAMSDFIDDGNEEDSRGEEENDSSIPENDESSNAENSDDKNVDSDDDDITCTSDEYETVHRQHSQRKSKVRRKKRSSQLISDEESDNNNNDSSSKLHTRPRKKGGRKEMRESVPHDKASVRQQGREKTDVHWDTEDLVISENAKMRRRKRRATLESSDDDTHEKEEDEDENIGVRHGVIKRKRTICSSDEDT